MFLNNLKSILFKGILKPKDVEIKEFVYDPRQILRSLERHLGLASLDLSLRDEYKGIIYFEGINASDFSIYSESLGKNIGYLRVAENPLAPGGSWRNQREYHLLKNPTLVNSSEFCCKYACMGQVRAGELAIKET